MSYIYKITNLINGKQYVGQTSLTIQDRFKEHLKDSRKQLDRPLYRAINKYGEENFIIEEIEECSLDIVNEREIYWIDKLGTYSNGYNATLGGEGRPLIDYSLIYDLYVNKKMTLIDIRRQTGHDVKRISKILQAKGITQEEIIQRSQEKCKKKVQMLDKKTLEKITEFDSVADASK